MNDYWDEYEAYDSAFAELKQSLIDSVKKEISDRFQALEKENAELKDRQKNLVALETEAQQKVSQLNRDIASVESTVKRRKANELFREIAETKYMVTYQSYSLDKCDKCNDKRQIAFTFPSGKKGLETCVACGISKTRQIVTEALGLSADIRNGELMIWYKPYKDWVDNEYGSISGNVMDRYKGQDFSELNQYRTLFDDKKTAQKYADYLNEKEN